MDSHITLADLDQLMMLPLYAQAVQPHYDDPSEPVLYWHGRRYAAEIDRVASHAHEPSCLLKGQIARTSSYANVTSA